MTKEIDIENVINMNYRVLTLLGMATSMIMDYKNLEAYHDNSDKCDWFMNAIEEVVYKNKPIPPLLHSSDEQHRGLEIKDGKVTGLK